jgi:hypothetical protein
MLQLPQNSRVRSEKAQLALDVNSKSYCDRFFSDQNQYTEQDLDQNGFKPHISMKELLQIEQF